MIDPKDALSALPAGLRKPLVEEYARIVHNYAEHRWAPAELSGGLFCEIAYTILDGHAKGAYGFTTHSTYLPHNALWMRLRRDHYL